MVQKVLVNRLDLSLSRKSVVYLTDHLDITIVVDWGVKPQNKQKNFIIHNRAPSSEFVSSSIPSWQILTVHAQQFRGARDLAFYLKVPLDSLLVWASSGGSGEPARMRRLAWTFAARIGDKYQIHLTWPNRTHNYVNSQWLCNWATSCQNQQNSMCTKRRLRSAWASAQSDQSSLSAWRKLGYLATHWAHSEETDQYGWMPRLIWVFAGCTVILLVLSWGRSIKLTANFLSATPRASIVSMSKWFVGSSRIKKLGLK